jgi:hypothetical protein
MDAVNKASSYRPTDSLLIRPTIPSLVGMDELVIRNLGKAYCFIGFRWRGVMDDPGACSPPRVGQAKRRSQACGTELVSSHTYIGGFRSGAKRRPTSMGR